MNQIHLLLGTRTLISV